MMNKTRLLFLCVAITHVYGSEVVAQSLRRQKYDSLLVGDLITPAVSSVMMPKGYTEILLNNSLLTSNSQFTSDRTSIDLNQRYTYLINTLQVTHGIAASGRLNVGLDLSYRTGRADADPESSPLKVFGNDSEGLIQYERAFTSVGIRARYVPTKNRNFVIQHVFSIPISSGDAGEFLGDNRYALNTQFLYTQLLGRKVFIFGQADVFVRFKEGQQDIDYTVPANVFLTYLLNSHIFPFVQLGMASTWNNDVELLRQSFSYGVGLQYQFNTMFNINAFYNDIFAGKNTNPWNSFNLGIRVVF